MTDLKKEIVCNEMLGQLGRREIWSGEVLTLFLGIMKMYVPVLQTNFKKLGDILEAFLGALWTDSDNDFQDCLNWFRNLVFVRTVH